MRRYYGPIQTKSQAESLAKRLDRAGTLQARQAACFLRGGWERVAARPELMTKMLILAEGDVKSFGDKP
jgi:hypothetical protein